MKLIFKFTPILFLIVLGCQNNSNNYGCEGAAEDTLAADTLAVAVVEEENLDNTTTQIKVPVYFDPKTPLTEQLKNADLHNMVVQKYYSFKDPKNRRKHKRVLHRRVNSNGEIDLTTGGPLSYEEMWELAEPHGHSLSSYFYDAAYIDKWSGGISSLESDPDFKYVDVTSNLAKVYFIDDFAGFVRYNKSYCDGIINKIERDASSRHLQEVQERQKIYE